MINNAFSRDFMSEDTARCGHVVIAPEVARAAVQPLLCNCK